jgi:hypothetical protein
MQRTLEIALLLAQFRGVWNERTFYYQQFLATLIKILPL